jgi:VanZ family protein
VLSTCASRRMWTPIEFFAVMVVYGACDEVTQPIVGRNCSIFDWLADIAGTVLAMALIEVVRWGRHASGGGTGSTPGPRAREAGRAGSH